MTSHPNVDSVIQALMQARRERSPVAASPLAGALGDDAARAYRVQAAVAKGLGWFGADAPSLPRHWKSGGGSRNGPITHAPLPPEGVRSSPANLSDLHFNMPGVETEIALRLSRDVTPEQATLLNHEQACDFVDAMAVSIEIVDSRWREGQAAPALLKLADSQSHGALVLGDWLSYPGKHDWSMQICKTFIGDAPAIERAGTHPLGGPAWLLPIWLQHLTQDGDTVPAGTIVTTGSWIGIVPVAAGQYVRAEFAGLGQVELTV